MSFLALIIFSAIAIYELPISLLPETEVPQLTVSVSYPDSSPQEIEQNVLSPIRETFATLNGLEEVESQASYEYGTVSLTFSYNASMDLAYIAANEKMDRLMSLLPYDLERPQIIKANTSDIPIIKIQVVPDETTNMVALSELVTNVIKKRVEQIEGVSLVDINGLKNKTVTIEPNQSRLNALGLSNQDIVQTIRQSNQSLGAVSVKDGQYRYNVKIKNFISDLASIQFLAINSDSGRTILLNQVATIKEAEAREHGYHVYNQNDAIVLNVHKQASARIVDLVPLVKNKVAQLNRDYENVEFITTQDQSTLLDVSIDNLTSSLIIGGLCAFIILFAFMVNAKIPLIIGVSLPSSLLLTFLLFWALSLSINIISLSGLALGLGMLIDNAIIVIDNITRKRNEGLTIIQSCVEGAEEIMSALISSVLTTLAVFIPLIFLGGISGALFYDQALSVAAILGVSLLVAFILLPVLYKLFFSENATQVKEDSNVFSLVKKQYKMFYGWVLNHSKLSLVVLALFTIVGLTLSDKMPTQGLPDLNQNQKELVINWNEPITVDANKLRITNMLNSFEDSFSEAEADIGISQYLLQSEQGEIQNARVLLSMNNASATRLFTDFLRQRHPEATFIVQDAPNAFEQIFASRQPYLEARFRSATSNQYIPASFGKKATRLLSENTERGKGFQQQSIIKLTLDYKKLNLYHVEQSILLEMLDQNFGQYKVSEIKSFNEVTPIYFNMANDDLMTTLKTSKIKSQNGTLYPISYFVKPRYGNDFKYVMADQIGTYQSLQFDNGANVSSIQKQVKDIARSNNYLVSFGGSYFQNKENLSRLTWVLVISVLLLYFILVAQFESFVQPFIVILTLPVGIAGSLYALYLTGSTMNIMSGIGIIIMLGIIVNDSILKIDTINRLQSKGLALENALQQAGSMRLKPILMTSITTILALLPILFFSGLGSTLQTPLVYAVTGGLTMGTIASLFLIPILYRIMSK